ncbi:MAG: APC family permease [Lachnospiraceae bacterium]|nr:APC family permease [Lachnospiraceae bacterium]
MEEKKLGLKSVISVSVGLVIATSCLVSLGQGAGTIGIAFIPAMIIACLLNMTTIASLSELNALMPNTTGGLAQYTLACLGPFPTMISMVGGYLFCNILSCGVEASIFAYAMGEIFHLPIPNFSYTLIVTIVLLVANLRGVDMFAKIQDIVAYLMVASMVIMGIIGMLGLGTGKKVVQPLCMTTDWKQIVSMTAVAFWLFIGAEYVIPISKDVKNAKRNVPLGMFIGLSSICQGMAKMNMMPQSFAKTNKHSVPYVGVWFVSILILVFAYISNDSSDAISFFILVGSVFWMVSYIFAHIDVLILRHRLPKAPRSFKVPLGPLFPFIGIAGTVFMILNISTDADAGI